MHVPLIPRLAGPFWQSTSDAFGDDNGGDGFLGAIPAMLELYILGEQESITRPLPSAPLSESIDGGTINHVAGGQLGPAIKKKPSAFI
jgi:hypothetical protein